MKRRVLFVSEAVSLAHVARPCVLADTLDRTKFEVHFASSGHFPYCQPRLGWSKHALRGLTPEVFLQRLSAGRPVYRFAELAAAVQDDLELIDAVRPDVIVSDFRLSLGISARVADVPLLSICNGHWSPYAVRSPLLAPDLAAARWLGYPLFDAVFRRVWPVASTLHVAAANRVRKLHAQARYRSLNDFYCDGDVRMYADTPALTPLNGAPESHVFLGPILWSPELALPPWWEEVAERTTPTVYITLGSTGEVDLLPKIVAACRMENLRCVVSTAGRSDLQASAPDVYVQGFLPGHHAAALASLVICNGGSATAHQALGQGRPVLGICSNLDQIMTMQGISSAGAGVFMRAGEASLTRVRQAIQQIQVNASFGEAARAVQSSFVAHDASSRFPMVVEHQMTTNASTCRH